MKKTDPQMVAAEFVWNVLRKTKGVHVKRQNLQNSQKLKEKYAKHWKIFEECCNILDQYPEIDPPQYIRFAVDLADSKYILPKILTSMRTFRRFYDTHGKLPITCPIEKMADGIMSSCDIVAGIMNEHEISTIESFMDRWMRIFPGEICPKIFQLIMTKKIFPEFISLLPNFSSYVSTYPMDLRFEMKLDPSSIKSAWEKLSNLRYNNQRMVDIDVIDNIYQKLEKQEKR